MAWHNRIDYPVEKIREWIKNGKTQAWIGQQLNVNPKQIYKVCKKHSIKCQRTGPRSASGHPNWNGGRLIDKHGYVLIYCENHPYARKPRLKYVLEHRLVMEQHLGRNLLPIEVVHHKNKDVQDNRLENLELFQGNASHLRKELSGRCPNWSEDGKLRIQQGIEKAADTHRSLKLNVSKNK